RAARLAERYALDRPMFFNPDPPDARRLASRDDAPVDSSQVEAWFAAARAEASGRADGATQHARGEAGKRISAAHRQLAPEMLRALLADNALVLGMGLELLHEAAGLPDFGRPLGEPRRLLRPEEELHNEALRRSVALWWRRHQNEYRERS